MSWLDIQRAFLGALLFTFAGYAVVSSTGCSGGVPTGSVSKAANNVQTGGSSGGGGGGTPTGTAGLRMVAFESGEAFWDSANQSAALGAAGEIWVFVTSNTTGSSGGQAFAQPTFTYNGQPETPIDAAVLSLAQTPPTTGEAWFAILQPAAGLNAGDTLIASATVGSTNVISNTVTVKVGHYTVATFANGFAISAPTDAFAAGYAMQSAAVNYNFAQPATGVSSYMSFTLYLDLTSGGFLPVQAVERTAPGSLTAGSSTNVAKLYLNDQLPPVSVPPNPNLQTQPDTYTYQVIAIDNTGWGVGSTVDSPNGLSDWIFFGVQ